MIHHYVTLFDSAYMIKGALMLDSLARHSASPYQVEVVALDDCVANVAAGWPNAHVTKLADLEAAVPELRQARASRSWREYCWTLGSVALRWCLGKTEPGEVVTYIDADLGFYSDPRACLAELGRRSIGIVPHRFAPAYRKYEATSGIYNVSWVSLRNDHTGKTCAEGWARQVLARCSASECGDQRYLDSWPSKYGDELCVFDSPGIGVAPWNVFGYKVAAAVRGAAVDSWPSKYGDELCVFNSPGMGVGPENVSNYRVENGHAVTVNEHPVVFYHYHEFRREPTRRGEPAFYLDEFRLTLGYPLRPVDIDVFYRDYCSRYRALAAELGVE